MRYEIVKFFTISYGLFFMLEKLALSAGDFSYHEKMVHFTCHH